MRSDRCKFLRERLDIINQKISECLDTLSIEDIPPAKRIALEKKLAQLQSGRAIIMKDLEKCEKMDARRHRKNAETAARKQT